MTQTQWLPGVIALAVGLVSGLAFLFFRKGSTRTAAAADDRVADLERRAQLILDQLKELNADRHHLDATQFEAEKARLEQEAAAALRARDEYDRAGAAARQLPAKPAAPEATPAAQGWLARHPQLKGAFWGGGVVLFAVILGLLLSQDQKPRQDSMGATGKTPPTAGAPETQDDPVLNAAMANYQAHPDNVAAMSRLSHELINRQEFQEAARLTERSLGLDPFHVESRIHRAVLASIQGDREKGQKTLEHLANSYPDAHEARLYQGLLALQAGEERTALEILERYSAEAPPSEQPPRLAEVIATLRKKLGLAAGNGAR